MNRKHLWLLVILLMALALRLTWLGSQSLWYDEGVTWLMSQKNPLELIRWTAADIQPPLYYLLICQTGLLFGHSEWALRFPSVIFGILTIPLIYVLARRLFAPPAAGLTPHLAAGLLAIAPVMVYYSQEARMYTLLVFEATLAGYLLLNLLSLPPAAGSHRPSIFLYALIATAALYTHYFAVFLLAAHALYALFTLWQDGWPQIRLRRVLFNFGLITLLFAPWLFIMLARLGDDPSYWPGTLKLSEALRKILISFILGETVFEQIGFWLALAVIGFWLFLMGFWFLTRPLSPSTDRQIAQKASLPAIFRHRLTAAFQPVSSGLFLLLWLWVPLILILTLSYQSPKFNPRYTLLAWPAFALLLTAGLGGLKVQSSNFNVFYVLRLIFCVFIILISTYSLTNWFTDRRFAKDDFKALAQFVQERRTPTETVLLSSGHLYPVWAYYYGWAGWTPLPQMERLDVTRVTDLDIAADLSQALKNHSGVWLVSWQDEVIDPHGVIPFWLDRIGQRPHDAGDFQGIKLEHWQLDPAKMARLSQSPIQHPASPTFNFANQVDLMGMTQLSETELALFWQPRQPLPNNLLLTLNQTDRDGFTWSPAPQVDRLYPPSRWPVGQITMTRHHLNWQPGTPPGLYQLEIELGLADSSVYQGWDILDAQDRPQRRTALVGPVNLSHLVQPNNGLLPLPAKPLVDFSPLITLRQSSLSAETAEPGDRLRLALLWQAGPANRDDLSVAFDLTDARGQTFRVGAALTPSRDFNLPRWHPGELGLGQYWLDLPPEAAPGPATLQLHLINEQGSPYDHVFTFGRLEILPTRRNFTPPTSVDMPLAADFSGQITLIGADCAPSTSSGGSPTAGSGGSPVNGSERGDTCRTAPGRPVTLTLYWRADSRPTANYTIFAHLLGPNETVLLNADHAPGKPTQGWVRGEIITDAVTLALPASLPPGHYALEVGLYNAADPAFPRLPLANGETRVILPQSLQVE